MVSNIISPSPSTERYAVRNEPFDNGSAAISSGDRASFHTAQALDNPGLKTQKKAAIITALAIGAIFAIGASLAVFFFLHPYLIGTFGAITLTTGLVAGGYSGSGLIFASSAITSTLLFNKIKVPQNRDQQDSKESILGSPVDDDDDGDFEDALGAKELLMSRYPEYEALIKKALEVNENHQEQLLDVINRYGIENALEDDPNAPDYGMIDDFQELSEQYDMSQSEEFTTPQPQPERVVDQPLPANGLVEFQKDQCAKIKEQTSLAKTSLNSLENAMNQCLTWWLKKTLSVVSYKPTDILQEIKDNLEHLDTLIEDLLKNTDSDNRKEQLQNLQKFIKEQEDFARSWIKFFKDGMFDKEHSLIIYKKVITKDEEIFKQIQTALNQAETALDTIDLLMETLV